MFTHGYAYFSVDSGI